MLVKGALRLDAGLAYSCLGKVVSGTASCICRRRYRKLSYIRRTKYQNLNDSRLVLQLSSAIPLKPVVKSGMKM